MLHIGSFAFLQGTDFSDRVGGLLQLSQPYSRCYVCKNNGIPFGAWRLYHWSTYDYGQGTRSRTWASRFQTACATVTPYPVMEAQTFFGVAAPIYPTHKPLSTQCFTSIVVTDNRHFLLAWGSQPLFIYFPALGQRAQAVLRLFSRCNTVVYLFGGA